MTARKMYVSGGIGSRYEGESFGEDYELPNRLAYAETCAAIGSAMWAWRMLLIEADARYADVMELQLYNAMLAGVSLDGETYFYQNPLSDEGHHRRAPWFRTACCTPNVARTLAALSGYVYGVAGDEIWVHLFVEGTATILPVNRRSVRLRQRTRYPWDGEIEIEIDADGDFGLRLRVPGWCETGAVLTVNGAAVVESSVPATYVAVRRDWRPGDVIRLSLPMPVQRVDCHPYVTENLGRVALMRGPILYCVEQADNSGIDLRNLGLPESTVFRDEFHADLLGGVVTLTGRATETDPGTGRADRLYAVSTPAPSNGEGRAVEITAIPYFAWANREPGRMRIWLRREA
jgi:DUF1680 family protein